MSRAGWRDGEGVKSARIAIEEEDSDTGTPRRGARSDRDSERMASGTTRRGSIQIDDPDLNPP